MINPFFKNSGPFKFNEILKDLNLKLDKKKVDIIITDIKDLQSFYVDIPSLELQLELVEYHNLLEEKEKKIQKQKELFLTLFQYDVSVLSFINSI